MERLRIRVSDDEKAWLVEQAGDASVSSVISELIEDARSDDGDGDGDGDDAGGGGDDAPAFDPSDPSDTGAGLVDLEADAPDRFATVFAAVEATAGTLDASPAAFERVREIVHADPDDPDLPDEWDADELRRDARPGGLERVACLAVAYDYLRERERVTTGALIDDCFPRASGGFSEGRYRKFIRYVAALPEVTPPGEGQHEWRFDADRVPSDPDPDSGA